MRFIFNLIKHIVILCFTNQNYSNKCVPGSACSSPWAPRSHARSHAPASFSREGALSVASERGPVESVMLRTTFIQSTDWRPCATMTGEGA